MAVHTNLNIFKNLYTLFSRILRRKILKQWFSSLATQSYHPVFKIPKVKATGQNKAKSIEMRFRNQCFLELPRIIKCKGKVKNYCSKQGCHVQKYRIVAHKYIRIVGSIAGCLYVYTHKHIYKVYTHIYIKCIHTHTQSLLKIQGFLCPM